MKKFLVFLFLIFAITSMVTSYFEAADSWSNGGYSNDSAHPAYGTHDWVAQHALDWLPADEKQYLVENLAAYLYGTELPDSNNASVPGHIGDTTKHHIYFRSTGLLQDDAAAVRAEEEYQNALGRLNAGNLSGAATTAGIMSHYIADMAVFAHVMATSTDWGAETGNVHSNYESYVLTRTNAYSDTYNSYLQFDGLLSTVSAYDAAKNLANDTTFDNGGIYTCVWMNNNYDTSNPNSAYWVRTGESLNFAVNAVADVLHTLYINSNIQPTSTPTLIPSPPSTIIPTLPPGSTPSFYPTIVPTPSPTQTQIATTSPTLVIASTPIATPYSIQTPTPTSTIPEFPPTTILFLMAGLFLVVISGLVAHSKRKC